MNTALWAAASRKMNGNFRLYDWYGRSIIETSPIFSSYPWTYSSQLCAQSLILLESCMRTRMSEFSSLGTTESQDITEKELARLLKIYGPKESTNEEKNHAKET